jgi:cytochrome P450 family 619
MALFIVAPAIVAVAFLLYAIIFVGRRAKTLPPGPKTLPIIGNLHQIPTKGSYLTFTKWAKQYGGIFSLKLGPGTAIVLTDRRLVKQLIDKKSGIYSNRPHSFVSHNLITGGDHILIAHYGKTWQQYRKYIHQHFMERIVEEDHLPVQQAEACQMMYDFLTDPDRHILHPKRYSNSIAMSTIWGVRTPSVDTEHSRRLYEMMERWSVVMEAGNTPPVELFPFLHYVPESMFGNWRQRASRVGDEMNSLYGDLLDQIYERRKKVGKMKTFMDRVLDHEEKLEFTRHQLYFMGGTMMEGASDTSSAIIIAGIQAMAKFPEVQKQAHAAIDAVVGEDRSPLWSDYDKIPYIAQVVKEAMRWRPVTPLAFPHCVDEGTLLCVPASRVTSS